MPLVAVKFDEFTADFKGCQSHSRVINCHWHSSEMNLAVIEVLIKFPRLAAEKM
jgi:hypothetical protein